MKSASGSGLSGPRVALLLATTALVLHALPAAAQPKAAPVTGPAPAAALPAPSATTPAPPLSGDELARRAIERRAVEAAIWGLPAVGLDTMRQEMLSKAGAKQNEVLFSSRPADGTTRLAMQNPDTIPFAIFWNAKDGPVVIEVPPAADGTLAGTIVDAWQTPLADVGRDGGDAGKGGKYVIVPPDHKGGLPASYIVVRTDTFAGAALLDVRLAGPTGEDVARAVALGRQIKVYPLSQAASPPATKFLDLAGTPLDATIRFDTSFFRSLDRVVQAEPSLLRDRAMLDPLRTLGIDKGKPFKPDARTEEAMAAGAAEARALLAQRYADGFPPMIDGSRWFPPITPAFARAAQGGYASAETYPTDMRAVAALLGLSVARQPGAPPLILATTRDDAGRPLDGAATYRLVLPPESPAKELWSITAYDRDAHTLLQGTKRPGLASTAKGLAKNADGTIEIFFGPTAPAGRDANWVPTDPARPFELLFRLYGPEKRFLDKEWKLPDPEKMADGKKR